MALSDFLKEQAAAALEHSREEEARRNEHERERKDAKRDDYRVQVDSLLDEFQEEVKQAQLQAEQIQNMEMPETPEEFIRMLQECERELAKPVKESALAIRVKGLEDEDDDDTLDFELPSQTIHDAWQYRFDVILSYAKSAFASDESVQKIVKKNCYKTKKGKSVKALLVVLGILVLTAAVVVACVLFCS